MSPRQFSRHLLKRIKSEFPDNYRDILANIHVSEEGSESSDPSESTYRSTSDGSIRFNASLSGKHSTMLGAGANEDYVPTKLEASFDESISTNIVFFEGARGIFAFMVSE